MNTLAILMGALAATALAQPPAREPLDAVGRIQWVIRGTIGPRSLSMGVVTSAWGTMQDNPPEYGTHWDGFSKRYGIRLTGRVTSRAIEATLGSIWGEDPRYVRKGSGGFGARLGNVFKSSFMSHDRQGNWMPAYARYAAVPSSNFLANTWRVDSDATANAALIRTGMGFVSRITSNAFDEFWPDFKRHVLRAGDR
jgi:hypothetical protein